MSDRVSVKVIAFALAGLGLSAPAPSAAQGVAGPYLAARHATIFSDFRAAADYYGQAIMKDPSNPALLESAAMSYIALGEVDKAAAVALVTRRKPRWGACTWFSHSATSLHHASS